MFVLATASQLNFQPIIQNKKKLKKILGTFENRAPDLEFPHANRRSLAGAVALRYRVERLYVSRLVLEGPSEPGADLSEKSCQQLAGR